MNPPSPATSAAAPSKLSELIRKIKEMETENEQLVTKLHSMDKHLFRLQVEKRVLLDRLCESDKFKQHTAPSNTVESIMTKNLLTKPQSPHVNSPTSSTQNKMSLSAVTASPVETSKIDIMHERKQ